MANPDMDLFSGEKPAELVNRGEPPSLADAPASGLLVTNHLNLLYMLAAGMVMPPSGFGDKYYQDTLACCPGWIPLFIGKPLPADALKLSTSEAPTSQAGGRRDGLDRPVRDDGGLRYGKAARVTVPRSTGRQRKRAPDPGATADLSDQGHCLPIARGQTSRRNRSSWISPTCRCRTSSARR